MSASISPPEALRVRFQDRARTRTDQHPLEAHAPRERWREAWKIRSMIARGRSGRRQEPMDCRRSCSEAALRPRRDIRRLDQPWVLVTAMMRSFPVRDIPRSRHSRRDHLHLPAQPSAAAGPSALGHMHDRRGSFSDFTSLRQVVERAPRRRAHRTACLDLALASR